MILMPARLSLRLPIAPGFRARGGSAFPFDPDALALFARMTVQPDTARKILYDTYIKAQKLTGIWPLLAADYLLAAHDAQAARLNIVQDLYNLTPIASPTFTTDRGYATDGVASLLSSGLNPTSDPKMLVTSSHISLFNRTNGALAGAVDMGGRDSGNTGQTLIITRNATDEVDFTVNTGATRNKIGGISDARGNWLINRRTSGRQDAYRDGVVLANGTALNFVTQTNRSIFIGAVNTNGTASAFAAREYAAASMGAGLSDQQILDFHNNRSAFLIAVGAKAP